MQEKPTECEYVYDAFDSSKNVIDWKDLHGKTFRLFVSQDRAKGSDSFSVVIGLLDERTGKKYIIQTHSYEQKHA